MAMLVKNAWLEVTTLPVADAVLIVRSNQRITTETELEQSYGIALRRLQRGDLNLSRLLMDMSAAPEAPEPRFSDSVFAHLAAIAGLFKKVAVVVRTAEARARVDADAARNNNPGMRGFTDTTSAMTWLHKVDS